MTVKIVKNSLENIKEEADNNYDLKRFLIKPYVENGAQNFQILHITVLGRNVQIFGCAEYTLSIS
jgi:hypothetical protein